MARAVAAYFDFSLFKMVRDHHACSTILSVSNDGLIKLSVGLESYNVALGTFALTGGSRTVPIFDRPVVPDRNYRGGQIIFIDLPLIDVPMIS